jgi:hypothetical protein
MVMKKQDYNPEHGSSRILAFISAILFMMLAWVVTHDYDPNAADKRNLPEWVKVASSEITQYALGMQTSLMRQRATRINSLASLSFENPYTDGYANPGCHSAECMLFDPFGGGATYRKPNEDWLDETMKTSPAYGEWVFPSNLCVKNLPEMGFQPCNIDGTDNEEVAMLLPFVHENICKGINVNLGLQKRKEPIPVNDGCVYDMQNKYRGAFQDGHMIADRQDIFAGQIFGCVQVSARACPGAPDHNVFFFILAPR